MYLIVSFYLLVYVQAQREWSFPGTPSCKTPDQKTGDCIPIQQCDPILDALDQVPQPIPPKIQTYLKAYTCGFQRKTPKVCCPSDPISFNIQEKLDFPDVSRHRNLRLLPTDCGFIDLVNKIVNGVKTGISEFPWMAIISYDTARGPQFKCGGTIINERYILTAAHCLTNLRWRLHAVRVGEYDTRTEIDCESTKFGESCNPPHQDLNIEQVIVHPDYNPADFSNDIGLIRVSRIDLTLENSSPICLPMAENRYYNFTKRNAVVTGWGITEELKPSPILLKVYVPVVPLDECFQKYPKGTKLDHRHLCAGGVNNQDSCSGDSGGPLQVMAKINQEETMVQQGIVSFGPSRCGQGPTPGVYTRVAAFMDWILDNLRP